jgi:transposase
MNSFGIFDEARLTTKQRQAFKLIRLEGRSIREAAEIMGLSRSTIYYHLKRATEKIKRLEAEKEYQDRIRKLEERISRLEQDFLKHVFEDHIIERFLRG